MRNAKIYFHYGAMGSSKTANALMVHFNYLEKNRKAILLKPAIECRDGKMIIKSRIGLSQKCETIENFLYDEIKYPLEEKMTYDAIIVDECQFAKKEDINNFAKLADKYNIDIFFYGLRTDFKGELFEGSKRLMEIADEIREVKTICWCGNKATHNARYNENGIVLDGEQIQLGANDKYISVCRKHYHEGKLFG